EILLVDLEILSDRFLHCCAASANCAGIPSSNRNRPATRRSPQRALQSPVSQQLRQNSTLFFRTDLSLCASLADSSKYYSRTGLIHFFGSHSPPRQQSPQPERVPFAKIQCFGKRASTQ